MIPSPLPACARCGAPTRIRSDGTAAKHCSQECYRRDAIADTRVGMYGPLDDPAAVPSPPYGSHLPGRMCSLAIDGERRRQRTMRGAVVIHGLVSVLTDHPHLSGPPNHAVWPGADHWWLYGDASKIAALANRRIPHDVGKARRTVTLGPAISMRTPAPVSRGIYRVVIDTQTPVIIRSSVGHKTRTAPDAGNVASSLSQVLALRLGLPTLPADRLHIVVLADDTRPWSMSIDKRGRLGGDGRFCGFTGRLVLECSGLARWLLACAERIGFGGRVGYGCGRITVRDLQ